MKQIEPPSLEHLSARQREVHTRIASGPRGRVRGPLAIWLHSPELADRAQQLGEFLRFGTSLPPRLSELAILMVARHWTSHYEWYVHAPIAAEKGLPQSVIDAIRTRRTPTFEREDEAAVHRFASEMLTRHALTDETRAGAVEQVGIQGTIELGAILGYYILGAITLAAAAMELPEGATPVLTEP